MRKLLFVMVMCAPVFGQLAQRQATVFNSLGKPANQATVTVCASSESDTNPATCNTPITVYSSPAGAAKANPFSTDIVGNYSFYRQTGYVTVKETYQGSSYIYKALLADTTHATAFAEQFASDWCADIQAAHDSLPSGGGIVDATYLTGTNISCSTSITLSKPVTILLGTGSYALGTHQILTSSSGIRIAGNGSSATTISYTGSLAAIQGSLGAQTEIDDLMLQDFKLDGGGAGAGAIGVQQITPVRHHYLRIYVTGFTHNIKLDGSQNYGTLNVLDAVTSRSCITTALWLFGNADLAPIYSGRVIADTSIIHGDYHCANGGTSIKLDSAQAVYIGSNLIENGTNGTGTGVAVNSSSGTSISDDVKEIGNDFEGLATGTSIQGNSTRTTLAFNGYFTVTTQLSDSGTVTTKMDLDGTTTDLYKFGRGLDLNLAGTASGSRIVADNNTTEPRTCWYRPTGGGTWYPFCIQNTNDIFQIFRGDATATIGTIANYNAVFSIDNTGAITQANNAGVTQSTISNAGLATFNGGIKAGSSGSTITDSRELLQSAHSCGTTSTCANTANGSYREIFGSVALNSATPSATTITGISPAFTSTATYFCTASPEGASAAIAAGGVSIAKVSGSSFTVIGPNTVTTVIDYHCVGN